MDTVLVVLCIINASVCTFSHSLLWLCLFFHLQPSTHGHTVHSCTPPTCAHLALENGLLSRFLGSLSGRSWWSQKQGERGRGHLEVLAPTPRECVLKLCSWKGCSKRKKYVTLNLSLQKGAIYLQIQAFALQAFLGRLRSCERKRMRRQVMSWRPEEAP